MPRESAFARLMRHFHEHPRGRLHEMLFFGGIALVLGGAALAGWLAGKVRVEYALLIGIIAACFLGFALLPQRRAAPRPRPIGDRRAQIAEQVRASKAERKRKKR